MRGRALFLRREDLKGGKALKGAKPGGSANCECAIARTPLPRARHGYSVQV